MVESGASRGGDGDSGADEARAIASTHESGPRDSASPEAELDVLAVGATVGRYLVVERIGAGAMGVVYAAYDPKLDRKIALKLLRPQEGKGDQARRTARLEREAQAIAKLSHPNVVGIFDVGVHDGQVFMAMEYLAGGTLRDWLAAKKRTWREIVKMFIEVGHGLAGAHAEGLIHRDFKPDNVLLDKNGVPKVVDFGLVRLSSTTVEMTSTGAPDEEESRAGQIAPELVEPTAAGHGASLTRTGALTGTPAYMAPEQFLGKPIDARTDQFAFCVALYEALYGERPFAGETVIALADSVTEGRLRVVPNATEVPSWVRACVIRGLRVGPDERYRDFEQLLAVLPDDPAARRRRRILVSATVATLVLAILLVRRVIVEHAVALERQILEYQTSAQRDADEARSGIARARELRAKSFQAFDSRSQAAGEALWKQVRDLLPSIDSTYDRAVEEMRAAFMIDSSRIANRERLLDLAIEQFVFVEDFHLNARRDAVAARLTTLDSLHRANAILDARGTVKIEGLLAGRRTALESYKRDGLTGRLSPRPQGMPSPTPSELVLAPGSYRLTVDGPSTEKIFYPFQVERGGNVSLNLNASDNLAAPTGFVYVPEGDSWFGDDDEQFRAGFLDTVPIHRVHNKPFLISKYETTYAQWIEFLDALSPASRRRRLPRGGVDASSGFVALKETAAGSWHLTLKPAEVTYEVDLGQPIIYAQRDRRKIQDWRKLPVTGISAEDGLAFTDWLDQTDRVPGARLCSESEWERAARGADSRRFPHGDDLAPDDANFDVTYGRSAGYGPDEVGSHPISLSPFGVADMTGNVWEITESIVDRSGFVVRGGSFYQFLPSQRITNRNPVGPVTRDPTVGLRVCATVSGSVRAREKATW